MDDKELEEIARKAETEARKIFVRRTRTMLDFRYDEIQEKFWDITTGTLLGGKSVDGAIPKTSWPTITKGNKVIPVRPSLAINDVSTGLTVEGSTWWPGEPMFLQDKVVSERGAMRMPGAVTYNTYIGPDRSQIDALRSPGEPTLWIEHIKKLFPDPIEHDQFFDFAAHMIQKPHEKVNHGFVLGGSQGLGKDTAMHPLRQGVGIWNTAEIGPDTISGEYNGFVQSVLLVINEVRPHDEDHKASNFYNKMKDFLAAPPDMLAMTVKYANTIYIRNLCHVILTTNDPLTMYIPAEDRRLFVMSSPLPDPKKFDVFKPDYFDELWAFLLNGGTESVIYWLDCRDILTFNPNRPPPMTVGKRAIIDSARQVRRTLIDDLFEEYEEEVGEGGIIPVIFGKDLFQFVKEKNYFDDEKELLKQLSSKSFHFKMDERGYHMVKCLTSNEWRNKKYRSRAAFVHKSVPPGEQQREIAKALSVRPLSFKFEPRSEF